MFKLGVMGLGGIANAAHLPCLTRFEDVELYGCDPWEAPREKAIANWNIPRERMFSDLGTMIRTVHPDGIYLLVPQYSKRMVECTQDSPYELYANQILEAGIPLFVEKPLGVNAEQARRLVKKAQSCGVTTTMVGCQRRFHPLLRYGMKLIKETGPLLTANFCFFKGLPANNNDERVIINHNWLTYDLIHVLDLAKWVPGGKVLSMDSAVHYAPDNGVATCFDAMFRFDNNVSSHFMGNVRVGGRFLRFELHTLGLSIYMSSVPNGGMHDMTAWVHRMDPTKEGHHFTPVPEIVRVADVAPAEIPQAWAGFWGQARHFIDMASQHKPTDTSFESALETIEICDQILEKGERDKKAIEGIK